MPSSRFLHIFKTCIIFTDKFFFIQTIKALKLLLLKPKRPTGIKKGQRYLTGTAGLASHAGAQPPYLDCWPLE
jgi:hypothetical protein